MSVCQIKIKSSDGCKLSFQFFSASIPPAFLMLKKQASSKQFLFSSRHLMFIKKVILKTNVLTIITGCTSNH